MPQHIINTRYTPFTALPDAILSKALTQWIRLCGGRHCGEVKLRGRIAMDATSGQPPISGNQRTRKQQRQNAHYAANKVNINNRKRANRLKNKDEVAARQRVSRAATIARKRNSFEAMFFGGQQSEIPNLQHVLRHRQDVLQAQRDSLGITIEDGEPCEHCGAKLLAKESKGMCCKNGKFVLPPLPELPHQLQEMYDSVEPWAQRFRKDSRMYNCRCNFASMNVQDGELKKMFGNHLLSVQGR